MITINFKIIAIPYKNTFFNYKNTIKTLKEVKYSICIYKNCNNKLTKLQILKIN